MLGGGLSHIRLYSRRCFLTTIVKSLGRVALSTSLSVEIVKRQQREITVSDSSAGHCAKHKKYRCSECERKYMDSYHEDWPEMVEALQQHTAELNALLLSRDERIGGLMVDVDEARQIIRRLKAESNSE
jgi:hypothetical protein